MIQTYMKNSVMTKTFMENNNHSNINEIKWDTDYDGNVANVSFDLNNNGHHKNYHFSLDNNDLSNILNMDSINLPLDKRLKRDFRHSIRNTPKIYQIEVDNIEPPISYIEPAQILTRENYLESPEENEEFIIPVTFQKLHKKPKTHKTYKVYRHKKKSSRKSKSKSSRKSKKQYSFL